MSKKATEFQRKAMSRMYRVREIFKPLNTGWIDENVACVREWVANIFFYRKGDTTIMMDAGYNYDRLAEKMSCARLSKKEPTTPMRFTMPMMNLTIPKKKQRTGT